MLWRKFGNVRWGPFFYNRSTSADVWMRCNSIIDRRKLIKVFFEKYTVRKNLFYKKTQFRVANEKVEEKGLGEDDENDQTKKLKKAD